MGQRKGEAQLLLADLVLGPLEAAPGGLVITHQTLFTEGCLAQDREPGEELLWGIPGMDF